MNWLKSIIPEDTHGVMLEVNSIRCYPNSGDRGGGGDGRRLRFFAGCELGGLTWLLEA